MCEGGHYMPLQAPTISFSEALATRIHELERELAAVRRTANKHRVRGEMWKRRCQDNNGELLRLRMNARQRARRAAA